MCLNVINNINVCILTVKHAEWPWLIFNNVSEVLVIFCNLFLGFPPNASSCVPPWGRGDMQTGRHALAIPGKSSTDAAPGNFRVILSNCPRPVPVKWNASRPLQGPEVSQTSPESQSKTKKQKAHLNIWWFRALFGKEEKMSRTLGWNLPSPRSGGRTRQIIHQRATAPPTVQAKRRVRTDGNAAKTINNNPDTNPAGEEERSLDPRPGPNSCFHSRDSRGSAVCSGTGGKVWRPSWAAAASQWEMRPGGRGSSRERGRPAAERARRVKLNRSLRVHWGLFFFPTCWRFLLHHNMETWNPRLQTLTCKSWFSCLVTMATRVRTVRTWFRKIVTDEWFLSQSKLREHLEK